MKEKAEHQQAEIAELEAEVAKLLERAQAVTGKEASEKAASQKAASEKALSEKAESEKADVAINS